MNSWLTPTIVLTVLCIVGNVVFTVWITIGGWFDLVKLLHDLRDENVDITDDGRVDRDLREVER